MKSFFKQICLAICILIIFVLGLLFCNNALVRNASAQEKFSLSGKAQGLSGSLLLELNGKEELLISGNNSFEFQSSLTAGKEYAVKIKKPARNYRCEIRNGKGIISQEKKASVEILCQEVGRWYHPSSLDDNLSPAGGNAKTVSVAMDESGNVIVAWAQHDGKSWRIYKSEYMNNKWLNPASLADAVSPSGGDAMNPRVAIGDNGDMVIVWEQGEGKNRYIFMAEKRNDKWQVPLSKQDHISPGDSFAWESDVAMDKNGNTIVVWSQETELSFHAIYKSEYRSNSWQHPGSLRESVSSSIHDGDGLRPKVVMSNHGESLIVWEQDPDGVSRIFMSEYRNGKWTKPADNNDYISPRDKGRTRAFLPKPAMDDTGRAVIGWQQSHGAKTRIYVSEYRNGAWHHPASLIEAISPESAINTTIHDVSMDSDGNIIIMWSKKEKRKTWLVKSEKRNGKWIDAGDDEYVVGPQKGGYEFRVIGQAAMSASGKAVIVSIQMGDDRISRLFLSEYDNNSWYLPGEKISLAEMPATSIAAAASPKGTFIVVWAQNDGKFNQVYKSEFRVLNK
jgi:hypothetical protein